MVQIEKEWAALHGDRILFTRETRVRVLMEMDRQGLSKRNTEVVALPKNVPSGPI